MCISATMMMMISTGLQVVGSLMQGEQQSDAAEARASENEYAAAQARADAQAEREAGEVRADTTRKLGARAKSQTRSALAKSGVMADAGSALTIQDYVMASSETDALNEILTGERKGRRLEIGAATSDREAAYERQAGENAKTSGLLGAGKSLLSGGYEVMKPGWKTQGGGGS